MCGVERERDTQFGQLFARKRMRVELDGERNGKEIEFSVAGFCAWEAILLIE